MIGVAEAADALGVSARRVRQMLADGVLDGERIGRAWVVDQDCVRSVRSHHRAVGRPWSPSSAWDLLAQADGEERVLSPVARSRAKKRLADGLDLAVGRLGVRAEQRRFYAHPAVLDRLSEEPQVVRGGASAVVEHEVDLVVGAEFEGYVKASELADLVVRYGLDEQAEHPNVVIRVVVDGCWPFRRGQRVAGRAVVAVDLLESDDPRSRRAGAELLECL